MTYPTEPQTRHHELGIYRVWQTGPDQWVADVRDCGEWTGPTEQSVVDEAITCLKFLAGLGDEV